MDVFADPLQCEPRAQLRLKAIVLVGLSLRARDEDGRDPCEDDAHDHHDREQLDEAVARLSPEPPAHPRDHFTLASTSASALRATSSLFRPIPHRLSAVWSTAINWRSASAPCHQPNSAPVTIQLC